MQSVLQTICKGVLFMVPVVQLVRASDCGSECRGFESHRAPNKSGAVSVYLPLHCRFYYSTSSIGGNIHLHCHVVGSGLDVSEESSAVHIAVGGLGRNHVSVVAALHSEKAKTLAYANGNIL